MRTAFYLVLTDKEEIADVEWNETGDRELARAFDWLLTEAVHSSASFVRKVPKDSGWVLRQFPKLAHSKGPRFES